MERYEELAVIRYNVERVTIFSKIIIGLTIAMGVLNILGWSIIDTINTYFYGYLILYGLIFFTSVAMLLLIKKLDVNNQKFNVAIHMYIALILLISALISYYDAIFYGHIMVFTIVYFMFSIIFITRFVVIIPISIISLLIIFDGLMTTSKNDFSVITYSAFSVNLFLIGIVIQMNTAKVQKQYFKKNNALKRMNEQLELVANRDYLTQLPNRNAYYQYVDNLVKHNKPITVQMFLIDVDFFKGYNDCYGHPAGDQVLVMVAKTLQQFEHIYFVRWGGEEFIGISTQPHEQLQDTCAAITTKISALQIENKASQQYGIVTASVGAANRQVTSIQQIEQLYKTVDDALYDSKRKGRNQYTIVQELAET